MEDELVQLATIYSDPGFLLLARDADGERLGCVGLRLLDTVNSATDPRTGEIRRLFVREKGRTGGVGAALVERLRDGARARGFDRLVLNTLPSMTAAIQLYRRIGFEPTDPYGAELLEDTLYFALDLPSRRTDSWNA